MTETSSPPDPAILERLLRLIRRLREETADFRERVDEPQLWYNRGYAQGMLQALRELGYGVRLEGIDPDPDELLQGAAVMPWGKAYRHGEQMGSRETFEITGNSQECPESSPSTSTGCVRARTSSRP